MGATAISYATKALNPLVGCPLPLVSPGCTNCWARELHNRRHRAFLAGAKLPAMYAKPFEALQWFPERLQEPLRTRTSQVWAVGFQTDLFVVDLAPEWIGQLWSMMLSQPRHTFLILTKRPDRMRDFLLCLEHEIADKGLLPGENIHLGVTVCTQAEADAHIPLLLQTPAAHRWISLEPLLEAVDLSPYIPLRCCSGAECACQGMPINPPPYLDGVILGCESGPHARPMEITWARSVRDQCAAADVKFYLKQMVVNGQLDHAPLLDGQEHRALAWGA